jgi:AraC-like DNA-binding protein
VNARTSTSPWQVEDPFVPTIDVTVPYADENRNQVLHREWGRQTVESMPPPLMMLPRHSEGSYHLRLHHQTLLDLTLLNTYSDAVAVRSGGPAGYDQDQLVTHLTLSGEFRFSSRILRSTVGVGAGTLCVRTNGEEWDYEVARGTRAVVLMLPASEIRFPVNTRAVITEQTSPAAALLLAQVRLWAELSDELGVAAARGARCATVELFRGLVNDQVIDDAEFTPALVKAAMDCIEDRLLADPDLSPRLIAEALGVSVRTLYRAFGQQATSSVMGYVLERRLERARAELKSTRLTVSEIAARWHFADSSHFVKAYKKRFGETPTAGRRN